MRTAAAGALTALLSAPALAAAQPAEDGDPEAREFVLPSYGTINPFYGTINPFYGTINPFYGDISPFWGDISPFWGDINPFYGDINAFWGDISPFYGDISPFWGDINAFYGDINAFYGDISAFWGDIGPFWGDINAFWGDINAFTEDDYAKLASDLDTLFAEAETVFGAAVQAKTGQSFHDAFLAELTARFGIDTSDPQSLADLDDRARAEFFMAFYDGLMSFTGADHVDHWMPSIGWSPSLSQRVGAGGGVTVGVLDFSTPSRLDGQRGPGGGAYLNFNHGVAVASLIGADMDGEGVMGVAPDVALRLANPFDESLTANWRDVTSSLSQLVLQSSDIINLSLGVPGWTFHSEWSEVFSSGNLANHADDIVFVFAAGNDGVTQLDDVDWSAVGEVENLLIVGSVNPADEISFFSNRPGEACLTVDGACGEGMRLMDRFLVAPGELILVPDGEGGVVRMSGTSFAAPLVTGAAALVQGRWNWLEAGDVASVLLWSAEDLGAPGVDPVYGWGKLDVEASMRPFDPANLYHVGSDGDTMSGGEMGIVNGDVIANVDADAYVVMFEDFRDTFRDFQIPLEDVVFNDDDSAGTTDDAQAYIDEHTSKPGKSGNSNGRNFTETPLVQRDLSRSGATVIRMTASPVDAGERVGEGEIMFQTGLEILDTQSGSALRFGYGEGALAFSQGSAFGLASDHRPGAGGVNPVLGFASGGAYMASGLALSPETRLDLAVTTTRDSYSFVNAMTGESTALFASLDAYQAGAVAASLSHDLSDTVSVEAGYTRLDESNALLGAQGLGALGFKGGAITDAATIGGEAALPLSLSLAGSATLGRTRSDLAGSTALSLPEAVVSTAFQVSVSRDGVLGRSDALRLSLIQPLHAETGALSYTAGVVADRTSGALGTETQRWTLAGDRDLALELLYAGSWLGDQLDVSVFSRVDAPEARFAGGEASFTAGWRIDLDF